MDVGRAWPGGRDRGRGVSFGAVTRLRTLLVSSLATVSLALPFYFRNLTVLYAAAALNGLALAFFPVKPDLWTMLIPTFGQQILINQFMRLEPVSTSDAVVSTLVTLVLSVVITLLAVRLYSREQIVIIKG